MCASKLSLVRAVEDFSVSYQDIWNTLIPDNIDMNAMYIYSSYFPISPHPFCIISLAAP